MMEPSKLPKTREESVWSKLIESLRKDVECFFGILKNRFFILKYGIRIQDLNTVDHIFLTCIALYQIRFLKESNNDEPWDTNNKNDDHLYEQEDSEIDNDVLEPEIFRLVREHSRLRIPEGTVGMPKDGSLEMVVRPEKYVERSVCCTNEDTHDERKKKLIEHFTYVFNNDAKNIKWPRKHGGCLTFDAAYCK
jgi:hypothetical protein